MRNLSTHEASTRATTRTRGRYTPAPCAWEQHTNKQFNELEQWFLTWG